MSGQEPQGLFGSGVGPLAEANLYRFSSKELHPPSGLVYYGYRFYDPSLQRWVSRDPVAELGFGTLPRVRRSVGLAQGDRINEFRFVANRPTSNFDPLGL